MSKDSRTQTHLERKRLNEDGLQQGEPPAKKGNSDSSATCRAASQAGNGLTKNIL